MALTRTTLSSAVAVDDREIVVASATGIAAGDLVKVDDEVMIVQKNYSSGTTIPVRRGQEGTRTAAHVVTAGVVHGTAADDYGAPAPGAVVNFPIAGRTRKVVSVTATSTLTLQEPGSDMVVILNGTDAITLTIPVPTTDMDGDLLFIAGNGSIAHLYTFTGGLNNGGSGYDVLTGNATARPYLVMVMAVNGVWMIPTCPALTGTVTSLVAGIA